MNIEDRKNLPVSFEPENFDVVCNLASQAGVRYSLEHPGAYIESNLEVLLNILKCCRIKMLIPMQPGDVERTWAGSKPLIVDYGW